MVHKYVSKSQRVDHMYAKQQFIYTSSYNTEPLRIIFRQLLNSEASANLSLVYTLAYKMDGAGGVAIDIIIIIIMV